MFKVSPLLFFIAVQSTGLMPSAWSQSIYPDQPITHLYKNTHPVLEKVANSTAAMIPKERIYRGQVVVKEMRAKLPICGNDPFYSELTAARCTGFLVGPDLLITAGHCMAGPNACAENIWLFDFKVNPDSPRKFPAPEENIYKCKKIISLDLSREGGSDFTVVRLDREVKGREPLKFREAGKVAADAALGIVGYPFGTPAKVVQGGHVLPHEHSQYFRANISAFGGNSGSPIVDLETGEIEGILVRGDKDQLVQVGGCLRAQRCEYGEKGCYPEEVSRITSVGFLKNGYKDPSALKTATYYGDLEGVNACIAAGADVNKPVQSMVTALHLAAGFERMPIVKRLLEVGANINVQDDHGGTPLFRAMQSRSFKTAEYLIHQGADVNIGIMNGQAPIHRAVVSNQVGLLELLLEKGASPETMDKYNRTPLHFASLAGNFAVPAAQLLLQYGAQNTPDHLGISPYNYSLGRAQRDVSGFGQMEKLLRKAFRMPKPNL